MAGTSFFSMNAVKFRVRRFPPFVHGDVVQKNLDSPDGSNYLGGDYKNLDEAESLENYRQQMQSFENFERRKVEKVRSSEKFRSYRKHRVSFKKF